MAQSGMVSMVKRKELENGPAGVWGEHKGAGVGLKAKSNDGAGLVANSQTNVAIHAETQSPANAVIAIASPAGLGATIYTEKRARSDMPVFLLGMCILQKHWWWMVMSCCLLQTVRKSLML